MKKYRKWLSICLVFCVAAGIMGGLLVQTESNRRKKAVLLFISQRL